MGLSRALGEIQTAYCSVLGENLVGIYLHGSIAMDCFTWERSDIDLLVVVRRPMTLREKLAFLQETVRLNKAAPPKGIEVSVMLREVCNPFVYPTPFELHFSTTYLDWAHHDPQGYCENMRGEDKDLAAHCMILRHRGRVLCGEAIDGIFAPVPAEAYLDSICEDIREAASAIRADFVYTTLNLCRVLAYAREGLILSKREGGEWGLRKLSQEYVPLLRSALDAYAGGRLEAQSIDEALAQRYCGEMLAEIQKT